jgi:hypothetical protein
MADKRVGAAKKFGENHGQMCGKCDIKYAPGRITERDIFYRKETGPAGH